MESKAYYIKSILKTLGLCAVGLFLGAEVFGNIPIFKDSAFLTAAAFAGLPFGWRATSDIFNGIHGLGLITMLLYYIFRIGTSLAIGWAIMVYRLGKDIVQLVIVCQQGKRTANAVQKETVS